MTRPILGFLLLWLLLVLAGCGGQPLDQHEYLLRPPLTSGSSSGEPELRLGSVEIAPYLDQDGVVLSLSDSEIHVGRQHTWAEPLETSILRFLQVAVGDAAGVPVEAPPLLGKARLPEIRVKIHQLHGTAEGSVQIVAGWSVTDAQDIRLHQFESQVRQSEDGYPALIGAHSTLLLELAEAIAEDLPL